MAALWLKAIALNLSISINSTAKWLNEMAPPLQHHFGAHQQQRYQNNCREQQQSQ